MDDEDKITVLVVDDQSIVRDGLVMLVDSQPDLRVVGDVCDGVEAVEFVRVSPPDVVLMDIRMPAMDGLEATRRITRGASDESATKVVILTTYDLDEYVYDALNAGASGFLLKHTPPEQVLLGIRSAADGGALVSPTITMRLIQAFSHPRRDPSRAPSDIRRLTPREREVFDLVVVGRNNTEIATELFIGESTVKTHLNRILFKLGLRDRVHAVLYAYSNGLLPR